MSRFGSLAIRPAARNGEIVVALVNEEEATLNRLEKKSDEVAEKENEKFGQFVGKEVNEMRLELGSPSEDFVNELGNEMLIYKTKKYVN